MATILTCYQRPKPGGLCQRYIRAIEALLAAGHTVHFLSVVPFPINHPRCIFHRFPWSRAQSDTLAFWALFMLLAPIYLIYLSCRHRVDHAFCFDPLYAFCMQPLRMMGILVPTCFLRGDALASLKLQHYPGWLLQLWIWLERTALHRIRVVGVARHLTDTILGRHSGIRPDAVLELPNDLPSRIPNRSCFTHLPLRIAMVGLLMPLKNHGFMLEVLSKMRGEAFQLVIYGQGPEAGRLNAQIADSRLEGRVSLAGWVPSNEIWSHVDLLVMPSLAEGMPHAILEAFAAGVPVLASDIPGHRMMLPLDYCLPLSDPDTWCNMLRTILDYPKHLLSTMREQQRQIAKRLQFDWDAHVVDMIVYRKS